MRDALTVYRELEALGSRPALTWYGAQRIELSGRVAANHMAKVAGDLLEEVWLEPGAGLHLDLPAHWKQVLWGLGGLLAGARVTCGLLGNDLLGSKPPGSGPLMVNSPPAGTYAVVTANPSDAVPGSTAFVGDADSGSLEPVGSSPGSSSSASALNPAGSAPDNSDSAGTLPSGSPPPGSPSASAPLAGTHLAGVEEVLALDLGPLAMSWTGPNLPAGVRDAAAEVMGAPDYLVDEQAHTASNAAQWLEAGGTLKVGGTQAFDGTQAIGGTLAGDGTLAASSTQATGDLQAPGGTHAVGSTQATDGTQAFLVAPSPGLALATALRLLGRQRLVVAEEEGESERIRNAENLEKMKDY